jgi:hypothetical protein
VLLDPSMLDAEELAMRPPRRCQKGVEMAVIARKAAGLTEEDRRR